MKNKLYKKIMFIAIAIGVVMVGCKKHDDDIEPNGGSVTTNSTKDTSIVVQVNDTLQPPAGDKGSKTFYTGDDHKIYTASQIDANQSLADQLAFAYNFNTTDPALGASITNLDNYPDSTGWSDLKNYTTFGTTTLDATAFDNIKSNDQLIAAYANSTQVNPQGAVHALAVGQIFAFQTYNGKNGLVKITNIVPGNDPSINYIVFDLKMQR